MLFDASRRRPLFCPNPDCDSHSSPDPWRFKKVGVIPKRLGVAEVVRERHFPWRTELSEWQERCYFGRIPTRRISNCRTHQLKYAV